MADFTAEAAEAITACGQGRMAPNLAIFRLCHVAETADQVTDAITAALARAEGDARARLAALHHLWQDTPGAFAAIKDSGKHFDRAMAAESDRLSGYRAAYDAISGFDPAITVALYSLGREDLLSAATAEIVAYLGDQGLLNRDWAALEIGCGIGRIVAALAPHYATITGVDIAATMVERARARCAGLANARLRQGDGVGFPWVGDRTLDIVLAVDSFPDIVDAGEGILRANVTEAARMLRPGGHLLILNFAYRGRDYDLEQVPLLARETGLALRTCGVQPFHHWDGAVFDLVRL